MGQVDPSLRLRAGQRVLTHAQIAEAERFAAEYAREQLSAEPADESAAEALLAQAYVAVGLELPHHVHWLDGPLELVPVLAQNERWFWVPDAYYERVPHCVWDDSRIEADQIALLGSVGKDSVDDRIRRSPRDVEKRLRNAGDYRLVSDVFGHVGHQMWGPVRQTVGERIWQAVADDAGRSLSPWIRDSIWARLYPLGRVAEQVCQVREQSPRNFFSVSIPQRCGKSRLCPEMATNQRQRIGEGRSSFRIPGSNLHQRWRGGLVAIGLMRHECDQREEPHEGWRRARHGLR